MFLAPAFWSVNWSAALFHLLNTVLTFILWAVDDNKDNLFSLTETAAPWVNVTGTNCTSAVPTNAISTFQVSDEFLCLSCCQYNKYIITVVVSHCPFICCLLSSKQYQWQNGSYRFVGFNVSVKIM